MTVYMTGSCEEHAERESRKLADAHSFLIERSAFLTNNGTLEKERCAYLLQGPLHISKTETLTCLGSVQFYRVSMGEDTPELRRNLFPPGMTMRPRKVSCLILTHLGHTHIPSGLYASIYRTISK